MRDLLPFGTGARGALKHDASDELEHDALAELCVEWARCELLLGSPAATATAAAGEDDADERGGAVRTASHDDDAGGRARARAVLEQTLRALPRATVAYCAYAELHLRAGRPHAARLIYFRGARRSAGGPPFDSYRVV